MQRGVGCRVRTKDEETRSANGGLRITSHCACLLAAAFTLLVSTGAAQRSFVSNSRFNGIHLHQSSITITAPNRVQVYVHVQVKFMLDQSLFAVLLVVQPLPIGEHLQM